MGRRRAVEDRYRGTHWGFGHTRRWQADEPGLGERERVPEMGKLRELQVQPRPNDPVDYLTLQFPPDQNCSLAFRNDGSDRLYCILPPGFRKQLAHRLIVPEGDWYSLEEVARAAGGRQARYSYPNVDVQVLGKCCNVVYWTPKNGDPEEQEGIEYIHRLGEEGGIEPYLGVSRDGRLWFAGGSYDVIDAGIRR